VDKGGATDSTVLILARVCVNCAASATCRPTRNFRFRRPDSVSLRWTCDIPRDSNLKAWSLANRLFQFRPREHVIQVRLQEVHLRFVGC
jgi:hypothetical protein